MRIEIVKFFSIRLKNIWGGFEFLIVAIQPLQCFLLYLRLPKYRDERNLLRVLLQTFNLQVKCLRDRASRYFVEDDEDAFFPREENERNVAGYDNQEEEPEDHRFDRAVPIGAFIAHVAEDAGLYCGPKHEYGNDCQYDIEETNYETCDPKAFLAFDVGFVPELRVNREQVLLAAEAHEDNRQALDQLYICPLRLIVIAEPNRQVFRRLVEVPVKLFHSSADQLSDGQSYKGENGHEK